MFSFFFPFFIVSFVIFYIRISLNSHSFFCIYLSIFTIYRFFIFLPYLRSFYSIFFTSNIFRVITNPAYFPNLKEIEQRASLFKMVGDITDEKLKDYRTIIWDRIYNPISRSYEKIMILWKKSSLRRFIPAGTSFIRKK